MAQGWDWQVPGNLVDPVKSSQAAIDSRGDVYVIVNSQNKLILGGVEFYRGTFLIKYSSNGEFLWVKPVHGEKVMALEGLGIAQSGDLWIAGTSSGEVWYGDDTLRLSEGVDKVIFLMNLDSEGEVKSIRAFGKSGSQSASSIHVGKNNMLWMSGRFDGQLVMGSDSLQSPYGNGGSWVAALDSVGVPLWVDGIYSPDGVGDIVTTVGRDGYLYGAANTYGSPKIGDSELRNYPNSPVISVVRYSVAGNVELLNVVHSFTTSRILASAIRTDNAGKVYVAGGSVVSLTLGVDSVDFHEIRKDNVMLGFVARINSADWSFDWYDTISARLDIHMMDVDIDSEGVVWGVGHFSDSIMIDGVWQHGLGGPAL